MNPYMQGIDSITGLRRNVARITDVLGAEPSTTPPSSSAMVVRKPSSLSDFVRDLGVGQKDVPDGIGTIGGAAAGAYLWDNHRVLGAIGGGSLGRNLPALMVPELRKPALRNLASTGAGIGGALIMPAHPVIGFILGALAGGTVAHFGGLR